MFLSYIKSTFVIGFFLFEEFTLKSIQVAVLKPITRHVSDVTSLKILHGSTEVCHQSGFPLMWDLSELPNAFFLNKLKYRNEKCHTQISP